MSLVIVNWRTLGAHIGWDGQVVTWRTLGAHIGWDGQVVTYPSIDAARDAWSELADTAEPGALGIIDVPSGWLADLGTLLRRWLADAPDRYAAELTARAGRLAEVEAQEVAA